MLADPYLQKSKSISQTQRLLLHLKITLLLLLLLLLQLYLPLLLIPMLSLPRMLLKLLRLKLLQQPRPLVWLYLQTKMRKLRRFQFKRQSRLSRITELRIDIFSQSPQLNFTTTTNQSSRRFTQLLVLLREVHQLRCQVPGSMRCSSMVCFHTA